jgi:hypothetical protein
MDCPRPRQVFEERESEYSDPSERSEEEEPEEKEPEEVTLKMIEIANLIPLKPNEKGPSDWIQQDNIPYSGWAERWKEYLQMPCPEGTETMEHEWRKWMGNIQERIDRNQELVDKIVKEKKKEWRKNPRPGITRTQYLTWVEKNLRKSQKRYEKLQEQNFWGWAEINYRRWTEGWRP